MAIDFSSAPTRVGALAIALGLMLSIPNRSSAGVLPSRTQVASDDAEAVEYPVEDHLTPVNFRIDTAIRAKVEAMLFVTGSEYGRMLIIPPEIDGESSISVHRNRNQEKRQCVVTCMVAETNLWNLLAEGENPGAEARVRRLDVPVGLATAEAIQKCWQEMLARVRPSSAIDLRAPTHLTRIEFSLGSAARLGETPIRFGDKVNELVKIGMALIAYCQAQPRSRPEMETEIRIRSESLLLKLKRE